MVSVRRKEKALMLRAKSNVEASLKNEFLVVGIGASAGGFEAFVELVRHLPENTGMAFVLVQHLSPTHKSKSAELLARISKLPVVEIENKTPLAPNHIYVLPANRDLVMTKGVLQLRPRKNTDGVHLPIDEFFLSLARDQRHRAIGIILSGNGSDGVLGMQEIKREGGITFAQDEQSSNFPGMPTNSQASGCVI